MNRILVVEDEPRLRRDLCDFLELKGFSVSGAASASEMREQLRDGPEPSVIVLDIGLPDGNGFDLATEARRRTRCGIIILSALGDADDRIRGFESGADIYLVKNSTLREIEAAIGSLLRRRTDPSLPQESEQWRLDRQTWMLVAPNQHSVKLTATELAFMTALSNSNGRVCEREELVRTLHRPRATFDNRHLDAVVSRLRRKIEQNSKLPAPINVVYGVGYTFTARIVIE